MSATGFLNSFGCMPEEEDFMKEQPKYGTGIKYRSGYEHQLADTFTVKPPSNPVTQFAGEWLSIDINGTLTIKRGYCWDGASGPTWDTRNCKKPSLVHDALYQLMRMEVLPRGYRKHADKLFYDMLRDNSMWLVRARLWYRSVRMGAMSSADQKSLKKIYTAP